MKINDPLLFPPRNTKVNMDNVSFGCSATYGEGVEHEETWPALLGSMNMGQPGSSNDRIARMCIEYIQEFKPKQVNILWTFSERREHIDESGNAYRYVPGHKKHEGTAWFKGYTLLSNAKLDEYNLYKNQLLVELMCREYNVIYNCLHIEDFRWDRFWRKQEYSFGTDGIHPGPDWHEHIAHEFSKKVLRTITV